MANSASKSRSTLFGTGAIAVVLMMCLLVSILAAAGIAGYQAGQGDQTRLAAEAVTAEIDSQYNLARTDLASGQLAQAQRRIQYIENVDPNYIRLPSLKAKLSEELAKNEDVAPIATPVFSQPTATPIANADTLSRDELEAKLDTAIANADWANMIELAGQLQRNFPDSDTSAANSAVYKALRDQGVAEVDGGLFEVGLFHLREAQAMGYLDAEAMQRLQWASLYTEGQSYWGKDWVRVIEAYYTLYQIAPYFLDTSTQLSSAYANWGAQLVAYGDYCGANQNYVAALEFGENAEWRAEQVALEAACTQGIQPTPAP